MSNCILVGCDLHDRTMLLQIAQSDKAPSKRSFGTDRESRQAMIEHLKQRAEKVGGAAIVFAYEAGQQGYGLYDTLSEAGIRCHILAPTVMPKSEKAKKNKTDEKDALKVLDCLRAHVLAGIELPDIWVPDPATRDDRELLRTRQDASGKLTAVKTQVRALLKRNDVAKPKQIGDPWSASHRGWLKQLCRDRSALASGSRAALSSLLRQVGHLEKELVELERAIEKLSRTGRYVKQVQESCTYTGVGILTAMVFLTEMGDLHRFHNRRKVAAYLGLAPSSHESGEKDDRKGHITRQGSGRVRGLLCQAQWTRIRLEPAETRRHALLVARNPKKKKVYVVAGMRRLAIRMWHTALNTQDGSKRAQACG